MTKKNSPKGVLPMTKQKKLRHSEYYDMQPTFDKLYADSKNGKTFTKLMDIISSEENIRLAYRNIKRNGGSTTAGTDKRTIADIEKLPVNQYVSIVQRKLMFYKPKPVKRVEIPKPNGKMRPLGIPTIIDRLVQQCILQVMEPICEAKFYERSNGFRPNRSAENAIAQCYKMINLQKLYYVVDVDIKGFFDNVNHGKLLKQIWTLGIRDKRLLCIISKILKSEIEGEGIPDKGTPQGGLISPLLSLIVLNELDWWVSSQWETFTPNGVKKGNMKGSKGWLSYARKYTNLKDGYVVRYADDFKIMCRNYTDAQRYYHATIDFLKSRLKLDISPEKSKVVNLRKNSSDFLGFKIKVLPKGKTRYGYIAKTDMSDKAIKKVTAELKAKVINIRKHTTVGRINAYNMAVIGIQNYYCIATNIYNNLTDVNYALLPTFRTRLSCIGSTIPFAETPYEFQQKTVGIKKETKIITVGKMPLLPLTGVHHKHPINFSQDITSYTAKGREKIHKSVQCVKTQELRNVMKYRNPNESIEFNDNSISAYLVQQGNCYVMGNRLNVHQMKCIRKIPVGEGGTDKHTNIAFISEEIWRAVMTEDISETIKIMKKFNMDDKQRRRFNRLRENYGLLPIKKR